MIPIVIEMQVAVNTIDYRGIVTDITSCTIICFCVYCVMKYYVHVSSK